MHVGREQDKQGQTAANKTNCSKQHKLQQTDQLQQKKDKLQ
jgi:hypothetical protein